MTAPLKVLDNEHFNVIISETKEQWKDQRLSTVTATDAAKMWVSPTPGTYRDIRESKKEAKNIGSNAAMRFGHEREPFIIAETAKRLGLNLFQNENLWVRADNTLYGATPDGYGVDDNGDFNGILCEAKTRNTRMGGESFEDLPNRVFRYFERDEEGIYRNVDTGEAWEETITPLHEGQMRWQRVTSGGNVKGQENFHLYMVETHEDFDPNTFELSVIKVEFTDEELDEIIDIVQDYLECDDDFRIVSAELDALMMEHERMAVLEKHYKSEVERVKNQIRQLTGAGAMEVAYQTHSGKLTASYTVRNELDKKGLEKDHPGLLAKYTHPVESSRPVLRVTPEKDLKETIRDEALSSIGVAKEVPAVK